MKRGCIALLAAVVFMLIQVSNSRQADCAVMLDKVVATVNDEVITWSELMGVINSEDRRQLEDLPDAVRESRTRELERPYLNNLIEVKLQVQEARKLGLTVDDSEIEGAIAEIKKKFSLTDADFLESLKTERMTMIDYKARLSEQIMIQKVVNMEVKSKIIVPDTEIQEYYETNKTEVFPEIKKVKVRQIFFAAPESESERASIESSAEKVYQRIMAGDDFEMMAMEYSEGPNRASGGDLGYISSGTALKEIDDTAEALGLGEVSRPFWSAAGLHIIKVEDRAAGRNLEKEKNVVKEKLMQKAFEARYHEWMAELREKAFIEIKL
jgi:peptidyl-prolyl cis-trans isomerase SurA